MGQAAKTYIYSVIGAGGLLLAMTLDSFSPAHPGLWAIYTVLAVLASTVKLRLPGMEGTYSFSFLFLLYGVAHLSLPETLVTACAAAVAQSLWKPAKRPVLVQVLFNTANLLVTVGVCFLAARVWADAGAQYLPAVMALVACAYFMVNTVLVSGVLSLLQRKRLGEVYGQWYVWSFPYYLVGVTLVALLPSPGRTVPGEAWLILIPSVYLVHFFVGLVKWNTSSSATGDEGNSPMPRAAQLYVGAVVAAAVILLVAAAIDWQSQNLPRFAIYLALAMVASTLKIRLPQMRGTVTPSFVLLLVAIAQLSMAEIAVMAAAVGLVQILWRSASRPTRAQLMFSPASLVVSDVIAHGVTRIALAPWLGDSVVGVAVVSALVLYIFNTVAVAVVLALVGRKPLSGVWQLCYFWSLPYYLVGAAASGIMTAVSRTADWPASLLVLPLMALVYISYRAQLSQAVVRNKQAIA
jgi:hypothetical protein